MNTFKRTALCVAALLTVSSLFSGCKDSSQTSVTVTTDYDPVKAVEQYKDILGEIPEADKNYVIEMGYNNCDHMVAALVGQGAGIYEALGLTVNITKTGKIAEAMTSGEMDVGYMGIDSAISASNNGAPLYMAAANHLGGSRYLVVSNDIESPEDLIGKKLAIGGESVKYRPEWHTWAAELGLSPDPADGQYESISMASTDALIAMKAGQLAAFTCCDPFGSQAEEMGIGRIMCTGWGADIAADKSTGWGMCCVYAMQQDFGRDHEELAKRLTLAHGLATQYLYEHPYNASMIFAESFGTTQTVGLRTMYMKCVKEGRTLTWEFSEENILNRFNQYDKFNIPEEKRTELTSVKDFCNTQWIEKVQLGSFDDFARSINLDEKFPLGMDYNEWLEKAMKIDNITDEQLKADAATAAEGHEKRLAAEQAAREKAAKEKEEKAAAEAAAKK